MKLHQKLLFILVVFTCNYSFSGNADTTRHKYLGIGIRANVFTNSDISPSYIPPARITLSVDPIKYMRFEGQYSFLKSSYDQDVPSGSGYRTEVFTDKVRLFTIGAFGMYRMQNTRFYLGVRWGKTHYSATTYDTSWGPMGTTSTLYTDKGEISNLSEVLGGEHFFGKHFSVGAEFSLVSAKNFFIPGIPSEKSKSSTYKGSESTVMFRFYPF